MRKRLTRAMVITAVVCVGFAEAGEPWSEKAYSQWTEKEVRQILQDSPWSRQIAITPAIPPTPRAGPPGSLHTMQRREIRVPRPGGGYRTVPVLVPGPTQPVQETPRTYDLVVRWISARTVREAMVRDLELQGSPTHNQQEARLDRVPTVYAVEVDGLSTTGLPLEEVSKAAYLFLGSNQLRISPLGFAPLPTSTRFYFPRQEGGAAIIPPGEETIEFNFTYGTDFKVSFDLKKMARDGKPDL